MQTKTRPKGLTKHYKITEIRDGQMVDEVMTRQKRDTLDPNDVDVQIDEPRREISIKHRTSAKSRTYGPGDLRGLGVFEWSLLADVVFSAGDIVELERSGRIHQRVRRIRRLFGDAKGREQFFITTAAPYGIAINTARTWRFIESLAE